jgi:Mrp family chromosome partitioning ATPase
VLGVADGAGLAGYLAGEVGLDEVVAATECPGLFVVPAGPAAPADGELLSLPSFDELLREARAQFDLVIVDSPALDHLSDALAIAARTDGALLHVRITPKGRSAALQARSRLDGVGTDVVGLAVRGAAGERPVRVA